MRAIPISRLFPRGRTAVVAATVLVVLLAGCGDDESGGNVVADATKDKTLPTQEAPPTTEPKTCKDSDTELTKDDKPDVKVPEGDPPKELKIDDETVGKGHKVENGDSVKVQYTGVAFSTEKQFDTSWDDLQPLPVESVGAGEVVPGFDEGLVGMQVGGRRVLIIPPDQGYGEAGKGDDIGKNETLVFVVDLVQVCYPKESSTSTTTTTAPADGSSSTTAGEGSSSTTASSTTESDSSTTSQGDADDSSTTTTESE